MTSQISPPDPEATQNNVFAVLDECLQWRRRGCVGSQQDGGRRGGGQGRAAHGLGRARRHFERAGGLLAREGMWL